MQGLVEQRDGRRPLGRLGVDEPERNRLEGRGLA
jgi:hypothetical protein